MTAQGKKWWGDPSSPDFGKEGQPVFNTSSIDRKVGSILSAHDQFILRTLFYPFLVKFNYQEANIEQFKKDLNTVRPMLDKLFDFEIKFAEANDLDHDELINTGYYSYLRCGLIERWTTLNEVGHYPNILKPLQIL